MTRPTLEEEEVTPDTNRKVRRMSEFELEKQKQRHICDITLEKIRVKLTEQDGRTHELEMNRHLSTPLECALHVRERLVKQSVVAKVRPLQTGDAGDDVTSETNQRWKWWDLNRALTSDCEVDFVSMHNAQNAHDQSVANRVFWRSCSFLLGYLLNGCFNVERYRPLLHGFPPVRAQMQMGGSFVYDFELMRSRTELEEPRSEDDLESVEPDDPIWQLFNPTQLNREAQRLAILNQPIELLDVSLQCARRIFSDSPHKLAQLASIAETNAQRRTHAHAHTDTHAHTHESALPQQHVITVYKMDTAVHAHTHAHKHAQSAAHVDVSGGPLMGGMGQLGRFAVTALHRSPANTVRRAEALLQRRVNLMRLHACALPNSQPCLQSTFDWLCRRAALPNPAEFEPISSGETSEQNHPERHNEQKENEGDINVR